MALEMLSRIISFAGLGLLGVFLSRIGIGNRVVLCLLAAFAVLEPFFGMASQARYDSFTFLLLSAALALASCRWWLPAGFVAAAAMEIQPIGILVPVITFFFLITVPSGRQGRFRAGAALLAGGVLFVPVYFLLHPNIFNAFNPIDEVNAARFQHAGFLYSYFWETQYKRHLPELAVFSASIILCLTRWRDERRRFALICTIAVAASSFILKWPNYNYTVFWYWAALLLLFQMAGTYRRASWICLIAAVYMLPQYGFVFAKNRNAGFSAADFSALRTAIDQAAGTSQAITVYGDYTLWFAMPETFIMANRLNLGLAKDAAIVACFDEQLVKDPLMLTCRRSRRQRTSFRPENSILAKPRCACSRSERLGMSSGRDAAPEPGHALRRDRRVRRPWRPDGEPGHPSRRQEAARRRPLADQGLDFLRPGMEGQPAYRHESRKLYRAVLPGRGHILRRRTPALRPMPPARLQPVRGGLASGRRYRGGNTRYAHPSSTPGFMPNGSCRARAGRSPSRRRSTICRMARWSHFRMRRHRRCWCWATLCCRGRPKAMALRSESHSGRPAC